MNERVHVSGIRDVRIFRFAADKERQKAGVVLVRVTYVMGRFMRRAVRRVKERLVLVYAGLLRKENVDPGDAAF